MVLTWKVMGSSKRLELKGKYINQTSSGNLQNDDAWCELRWEGNCWMTTPATQKPKLDFLLFHALFTAHGNTLAHTYGPLTRRWEWLLYFKMKKVTVSSFSLFCNFNFNIRGKKIYAYLFVFNVKCLWFIFSLNCKNNSFVYDYFHTIN